MRLALGLLLVILALSPALQAATLFAPAVDSQGNGIVSKITVVVRPGNGSIHLILPPYVSTDTQQSMALAANSAAMLAGKNPDFFDYFITIDTNASLIDGPSGGLPLALAAYSEFSGKPLRTDLAATGTISEEGVVGSVGGVPQKADALPPLNITLLLVPKGQSIEGGVDVATREAQRGLQVVEVGSLKEAVNFAFTPTGSRVNQTRVALPPFSVVKYAATSKTQALLMIASMELQKTRDKLVTLNVSDFERRSIQENLNDSQILVNQGYGYSAANLLFITEVALDTFELASKNTTSAQLDAAGTKLLANVGDYRFKSLTMDNWELVASGQLRAHWAENQLQKSLASLREGSNVESLYHDFALAQNWARAAAEMDAQAPATGQPIEELKLRPLANELIGQASNLSKRVGDDEALTHLDGAKLAFSKSRYAAAVLDAGLAVSFYNSTLSTRNLTLRKIQALAQNLSLVLPSPDKLSSAWAEAYQSHGLYDMQEANRTNSPESYTQALKLFLLSGDFEQTVRLSRAALEGPLPPAPTPELGVVVTQQPEPNAFLRTIQSIGGTRTIIAFLVGILVAAVVMALWMLLAKPKAAPAPALLHLKTTRGLWRKARKRR